MNLEQLLARARASAGTLSTRQLITLGAAFVGVVGLVIGSAYWLNTPNYGVLFSDMDAESATALVTKLKSDKVPYVLEDSGRTVRVPSTRIDELRLDLASQGLPASGRVGFEIFDRTAFGVTDFLEHVNYRRALEGELARTISTISDVAGARVHLAIAQPSLFSGQEQAAKASVVVKLRNNRRLSAATVGAITGLVASSVESLKPEAVVVIDNYGRPLTRADSETEVQSGLQLERQQRLEHDLSAKVVALVEPIVGAGRVRVNVSARIAGDSQEETEERWDPTTVLRSRQIVNQAGGGPGSVQGVAGSRSNLPPDPNRPTPPAPVAAQTNAVNTAETTNYEVSKLTRHRVQPRGQIARLSVAVVLDDDHEAAAKPGETSRGSRARSAADIKKIHDLVAASVGLDVERGDQLTVENIPFEEAPVEPIADPGVLQRFTPNLMEVGRVLGIIVIVALAIFGFMRPMVRASLESASGVTPQLTGGGPNVAPRTIADLESDLEAQLAAAPQDRRLPVLTRHVSALAQREPENAARLVRTWLSQDEH